MKSDFDPKWQLRAEQERREYERADEEKLWEDIWKVLVLFLLLCILVQSSRADTTAVCSFYRDNKADQGKFVGQTASGVKYDEKALTCAHRTLPFGSLVRLTAPNGSVVVKVVDRGPFVSGREFDLTPAAFAKLAPLSRGLVVVKVELLSLGKKKQSRRGKR